LTELFLRPIIYPYNACGESCGGYVPGTQGSKFVVPEPGLLALTAGRRLLNPEQLKGCRLKAATLLAVPTAGQRRPGRPPRAVTVDVTLGDSLPGNPTHPLAGLTPAQRTDERRHALAQVLAAVGRRRGGLPAMQGQEVRP
jgi:hypothetical protein